MAATMEVVPAASGEQWNERERELIKLQIAPGISDGDMVLFGKICRLTGLDPFRRQIYAVMRNQSTKNAKGEWTTIQKMTVQTGIDGYRAIAARTGQLAGIDDATYDREDGQPNRATVTVYRMVAGVRCPFTATARWSEYVQLKDEYDNGKKTGNKVPTDMWARMPFLMLGKCAEALALRKAFPDETSGVYTAEEMAQADNDQAPTPVAAVATETEQEVGREDIAAYALVHNIPMSKVNATLKKYGGSYSDTLAAMKRATQATNAVTVTPEPETVEADEAPTDGANSLVGAFPGGVKP